MNVTLTLDDEEIMKVKSHLRIVHKSPSIIFPDKQDVKVEVNSVHDIAAVFVAGRVVPFNTKRRA
jgi:hypothetical protein